MATKIPRKTREDIEALSDQQVWIPQDDITRDQIDGALKPLDALANEMEERWGRCRLQELVTPATASRFQAASQKLNVAILSNDIDMVIRKSTVLIKGWRAMENEALKAGHKPMPPELWDCHAPEEDGKPEVSFVIAKNATAATLAEVDVPVYTTQEIARIIRAWRLQSPVQTAKTVFPDAEIVRISNDGFKDDDLPF